MNYLVRRSKPNVIAPLALAVLSAGVILGPAVAPAQTMGITQFLQKIDPLVSHSSQGYLGVLVSDLDSDSASKLKLKEVRGALITLIDHDAPAGQVGLRVNDVVLEVNGQKVEGAEQFGRMLREFPAGRKVSLLITRDGSPQTMEVQLCDRKVMEQDVWNKLGHGDGSGSAPALGILAGGGDAATPGFHMPFFGSTLNVGAMVEPLGPQMADYLGISNGIMVSQVARKSEAAAAGLKPHDVILKVGNEAISTTADWDRALRANQGKPVPVTILRDRKQQIVNLQVDSKHKSEVEFHDFFPGLLPDGPCPLLAELDPRWTADAAAVAEELRRETEQFRQSFNASDFKIDPKQMEQFKKDMEQFQKDFNSDTFKIDPKQMEEMKRQMEEFRKSMPDFNRQMDQLKREMQQLHLGIGQQA